MTQPSSFRILTALAPFALVATLLGGTLLTTSAQARPANLTLWTYYADASKTSVVGYKMLDCDGDLWQDGTTSSYHDVSQESCNPYPGPGY